MKEIHPNDFKSLLYFKNTHKKTPQFQFVLASDKFWKGPNNLEYKCGIFYLQNRSVFRSVTDLYSTQCFAKM